MDAMESMASLAVEYWRLLRLCKRTLMEQPPNKHAKGMAQVRYASNRLVSILEENGIRLIVYEGEAYTPNLPVSVVNSDEFEDSGELFVDQTIDPTLIKDGNVLVGGKVVVRKGD